MGQGLVRPWFCFELDDFLVIGPPGKRACLILLATLQHIFGMPMARKKTEGLTMVLKFLGIIIDTTLMDCRLPSDNLEDLWTTVAAVAQRSKFS